MQDKRAGLSMVPPLHSLVAFETVARLQSATAAARLLGVSRSALSHSLTLLEHRLGVRLFLRYSPTAELTAAGRIYYDAVERFARSVADGLYDISGNARIALRLSASPGLSRLWLSKRLAGFQAEFPRVELSVTVSESLADLLGHQTDVALRYGGTEDAGTVSIPLWRETVAPVARPDIAQSARAGSLDTLVAGYPLIEHAHWNWRDWLATKRFAGTFNRPLLTCHDLPLTLEAAVHGFGVALAPLTLIADHLNGRELAQAHESSLPGQTYRAVATTEGSGRPVVAAFLQWIQGELRPGPPRGGLSMR